MTTPPFHSFLFVGALLLALLPALRAADRVPSFQTQAPQTASPVAKKKGFFSMLFGGKTRKEDDTSKRSAAVSLPRSQMPQIAASLPQPSRIYSNPITSGQNGPVLPPTPSLVVVPVAAPPSLDPALPSATGSPSIMPLPGTQGFSATNAPAAAPKVPAPAYAHPVPGKPGLVYPPGTKRIPANIVDVSGMTPGTKARDPVTNIIFLVP